MRSIVGVLLASIRILIVMVSMLLFLAGYILTIPFHKNTPKAAFKLRQYWLKYVGLPVFNIHITVTGESAASTAIYVCNHRSFSDPMIICRYIDAYVIAKAEIASYPIINKGAEITGVIWVDRGNRNSRQATRMAMIDTIQKGHNVLVFPEGTVGVQETILEYKKGTFDEATYHKFNIIPLAISYKSELDLWHNKNLIAQYFYQFAKWKTEVKLTIGEVIDTNSSVNPYQEAVNWTIATIKSQQKDWSNVNWQMFSG